MADPGYRLKQNRLQPPNSGETDRLRVACEITALLLKMGYGTADVRGYQCL